MTDPAYPEPTAHDFLCTALHWAAGELDRVAGDWESTAANGSLHGRPGVLAHAGATARANREAARLVRQVYETLSRPVTPPSGISMYASDELLYVLTRGDAESYVEEQTGFDDERVTPATVDAFAAVLKRTIDLDPGWGERLEACCEVAWERFVDDPDHPERKLLTTKEDPA